MNKTEFTSRVFANPDDDGADLLESAQQNAEHRLLWDDVRQFNTSLRTSLRDVPIPVTLADRLKAAAADSRPQAIVIGPRGGWQGRRRFALAASVLVAVTVGFASLLSPAARPSAEELAFSEQVLDHVHHEFTLYNSGDDVNFQFVNQVMAAAGGHLLDNETTRSLRISFAKTCILSGQQQSAHLVIRGENGLINVIVVKNRPVSRPFPIEDGQYSGTVVPMESGNVILLGEKDEGLQDVLEVISENMEWVI